MLTTLDRNPELLKSVGEALGDVGGGARDLLGDTGELVKSAGKGAESAVQDVGQGAGKGVAGIGHGAQQGVEGLGQGAQQGVEGLGEGAGQGVEGVGQGAQQGLQNLGQGGQRWLRRPQSRRGAQSRPEHCLAQQQIELARRGRAAPRRRRGSRAICPTSNSAAGRRSNSRTRAGART